MIPAVIAIQIEPALSSRAAPPPAVLSAWDDLPSTLMWVEGNAGTE